MRLLTRVTVTATPDTIEIPPEGPDHAPKAKVEATVEFLTRDGGSLTYSGFLVEFTLQEWRNFLYDPVGKLFPNCCPTDDSGKAFVYFRPKNPGTAQVTATVSTGGCPGDPTVLENKALTEKIAVTRNAWVAVACIDLEEIGAVTGDDYYMFNYRDGLVMQVPFTIDEEGAVQSDPDCSLGTHEYCPFCQELPGGYIYPRKPPIIEATRSECSIRNLDLGTPRDTFKVTASGHLNGDILTLNIYPLEPLTIMFDIYCRGDDWEQTIPWTNVYGVNEWGLMQDKLRVELPLVHLAESGPGEVGTVAFGDTALRYWFKVSLKNDTFCFDWPPGY